MKALDEGPDTLSDLVPKVPAYSLWSSSDNSQGHPRSYVLVLGPLGMVMEGCHGWPEVIIQQEPAEEMTAPSWWQEVPQLSLPDTIVQLTPTSVNFFRKRYNMFAFSSISQHCDGTGDWNPSLWMSRASSSCIFNIIVADGLVMPGARASAAMMLT